MMEYARLFTPSGERLHNAPEQQPWNAYPRPQLRRDSFLCLNGWWDFAVTQEPTPPEAYDRTIRVPYPPESLLSGVEEVPRKAVGFTTVVPSRSRMASARTGSSCTSVRWSRWPACG